MNGGSGTGVWWISLRRLDDIASHWDFTRLLKDERRKNAADPKKDTQKEPDPETMAERYKEGMRLTVQVLEKSIECVSIPNPEP